MRPKRFIFMIIRVRHREYSTVRLIRIAFRPVVRDIAKGVCQVDIFIIEPQGCLCFSGTGVHLHYGHSRRDRACDLHTVRPADCVQQQRVFGPSDAQTFLRNAGRYRS